MGWLSRLFGNSTPANITILPERIWLTGKAKYNGIASHLAQVDGKGRLAVLLVSHFSDVAGELQRIAAAQQGATPVLAVSATDLSAQIARDMQASESDVLEIVVGERHPLTKEDDRVMKKFAEEVPCRCEVSYNVSLEDPLMEVFVNDTVRKMITMLGMKEDEAIESQMVQRRVRSAQEKFTKNATGNQPAATAKEWIEKNING